MQFQWGRYLAILAIVMLGVRVFLRSEIHQTGHGGYCQ